MMTLLAMADLLYSKATSLIIYYHFTDAKVNFLR